MSHTEPTIEQTEPPRGDRRAASREEAEDRRKPRGWFERPRIYVLLYVAAFIAQEAVGQSVGVQWQILLLAFLVLYTINHAIFGYRNARTSAIVMGAIFITRLIATTLPVAGVAVSTRAGMLGVVGIVIARLTLWVLSHDVAETRKIEGFSLRRPVISTDFTTALVALSGLPIGLAIYAALDTKSFTVTPIFNSLGGAWTLVVVLLAIAAVSEEMIFRQLVAAMVQHTGGSQTPLVAGAIYAGLFIGTGNIALIAIAFVTGAWFAWSCERTGSLQGPIISHIVINILVFVVMPSSGLTF